MLKKPRLPRHTGIQSWGSEDPVNQSSTHSHKQGGTTAEPGLEEDGRRVIGDNIYPTKLLHKHHKARRLSSAPISWHPEHLHEEVTASLNVRLRLKECVRVEHVTGGLERRWSES